MNEDTFLRDCESICFECGSSEGLTVTSPGVALCPKCLQEEREV